MGLSAISLPDTGMNIFNLLPADQLVFGTSSYRRTSAGRTVRSFNLKMDDLRHDNSIVKGLTCMKAFLHWEAQRMNYGYLDFHGAPNTESGQKTSATFVWEGDDLVLDNRNVRRYKYVLRSGNTMMIPHLSIHHVMAEKMGWFEKNLSGQWVLGRNLNMEFIHGTVPNKDNIE